MILAVLTGLVGLAAGFFAAAPLLRQIRTPEEIMAPAVQYLRIYLIGYPLLLIYDFGSAAMRARGNSRYPFAALVISGLANVALNLFFVIVLGMGVAGVALATDISTALAALMVLRRLADDPLFRLKTRVSGLNVKSTSPLRSDTAQAFSTRTVRKILETGIPSALQGAVFCFANIFVQASINRFGETAIAGSTIAMNFEYFTYYIITAFGQTATTFTGQNFAAGACSRCRQIHRRCLSLAAVCSSIPIFAIVLLRGPLSDLFTQDAAVVGSASVRILRILLFEPICNLYEIPAGVLRGSGHILWICTVFRLRPALTTLYHAFPLSWVTTILLVGVGYQRIQPLKRANARDRGT